MKSVILAAFFALFTFSLSAQNATASDSHAPANAMEFVDDFANDPAASKIITNEISNIDGSPFVTDDWLYAKVTVDSSRIYENVQIRLNVYDNKIHFKDTEGKERMLNVKIKEIQITDGRSEFNNAIFITGIAPNKNQFYRVLTNGSKIRLLQKFSARKSDIKVFNGEPKMQFDVDKELWFYSVQVKNMYKQTKKCEEIMEVFGNDKKITDFVYKNGIRCNKKDDVLKLVEFYNSY